MNISTLQRKPQNIFVTFLSLLGVSYTNNFSNKYFNEHPHKYNLFGLSKMLSEFNIENVALKIKDKDSGLSELESPFIAHTGDFVIVTEVTSQKVNYIWNGKNINIPRDEFCKLWTGITLLAEPDENSKEPYFEKHIREERIQSVKKITLFVASVLFLSYIYISQPLIYTDIGFSFLLLLNIIGVYISYQLVLKQMKVQSDYADKICSLFKQSDCNNILESDASRILGTISWSEIGLGYFIANTLILLFFPHLISYMTLINICALPYTMWSIWYQKFRAKQWCPLCLIVQGLLWGVFLVGLLCGYIALPTCKFIDILTTGTIYIIPILIANLLILSLSKSENVEQIKQELNSIKADENIFIASLKKQPYYEVDKNTSGILWGNTKAPILITIFTNPHCDPCSKLHKRVEQFLKEIDNACIQYIFTSFNPNLESSNKYLIATFLNNDIHATSRLFGEWFETGKNNKKAFFEKYPQNIDSDRVTKEFSKHLDWKRRFGLSTTPTILINGYKLPDNYKIEDIKYFTDLAIDTK